MKAPDLGAICGAECVDLGVATINIYLVSEQLGSGNSRVREARRRELPADALGGAVDRVGPAREGMDNYKILIDCGRRLDQHAARMVW